MMGIRGGGEGGGGEGGGGGGGGGGKEMSETTMTEKFSKLMLDLNPQIQDS
jgi:hypothetical protein